MFNEFHKVAETFSATLSYSDFQSSDIHSGRIDNVISANLPNEKSDLLLFQTINIVHNPYRELNLSAPCITNVRRKKKYPLDLTLKTRWFLTHYCGPRYSKSI